MSSCVGQNPTFSCPQFVMNIVMGGWDLDEKSLGKWQKLQHCKSIIPQNLQGMKKIGLTFSVGSQIVLSKIIRTGDTKYHI